MSAADIRALFEARRALVAKPIPFDVPGFGSVFIKILDAGTAGSNADVLAKANDKNQYLIFTAALAVCDEDGVLVFDISKPDDVELLKGIDPKTLTVIFQKSQLENAQSPEGATAAGNALPLDKSS